MDYETLQIHLYSKNATKYNNGSLSDVTFSLPNIEVPLQHHLYLTVQNFILPYSFYNIDSYNNKIEYIEVDTNNHIITQTINYITSGNYNAIQLLSYLNSGIFPNLSVTYDFIKSKFIFINLINNFYFNSSNSNSLLGFSENIVNNTSIDKLLISYNVINLSSKPLIFITSNFETNSINNILNNRHNILCAIPIVNSPYNLIHFQGTNRINLFTNVINSIDIRVCDQNGDLIDLNGQYFNLCLNLDVIKFVE
jgi:hypothetical protein